MKKSWCYLIIAAALLIAAGFWVRRQIWLISHSDPDYNTVYSPGYDDEKFDNRLIGLSEKDVIGILGQPLYKTKLSFLHVLLYTENKSTVFASRTSDCIVYEQGHKKELQALRIYFDSTGKVFDVKTDGYPAGNNTFTGLTNADIISKMGQPDDEIIQLAGTELLSFSELTHGTQSGKTGTYHVRQIILNKDKIAIAVIRELGGMQRIIFCKH